jgi:hypothetical protein
VELKTRGEPLRLVVVIRRENHRRVSSSWVILPTTWVILAVINLDVRGRVGNRSTRRASEYNLAHVRESFVPRSGDALVGAENSLPHGDEQGFHRADEVDI